MLKPVLDYLLCEEIKPDLGSVSANEIGDHWQKFMVLAAGPGRYDDKGGLVPMPCKVGDIVYVQKHAEADSPPELETKTPKQALIMASRVMGIADAE